MTRSNTLVSGGTGDDSKGYFIKPTIFADLDPKARLMQEEILLATSKASSKFDTLENATTGPKISSCISLAFGSRCADVYMGPVIDQGSYDKIMSYIEIGKEEGRLVSGGQYCWPLLKLHQSLTL
jgi:acyl-CoA reductase-like NAD-dependent aldehyde dehydrogenase